MGTSKLKTLINYLIDNVENEKELKEIYSYLKTKLNIVNEPTVTYISVSKLTEKNKSSKKGKKKEEKKEDFTKPGKPMSMEEFNKRIDKSLSGKSTSHEDFLKEMETWD